MPLLLTVGATLTIDGKQAITAAGGRAVMLHSDTTPAPSGGRVRLRLDYQDPLSGWVFRRTWDTDPGGSITFTPPAVGLWRVRASFYGTRASSPSGSREVTIRVTSVA